MLSKNVGGYLSIPIIAVNPGKNGRQNRPFCQMLCRVRYFYAFYTIYVYEGRRL